MFGANNSSPKLKPKAAGPQPKSKNSRCYGPGAFVGEVIIAYFPECGLQDSLRYVSFFDPVTQRIDFVPATDQDEACTFDPNSAAKIEEFLDLNRIKYITLPAALTATQNFVIVPWNNDSFVDHKAFVIYMNTLRLANFKGGSVALLQRTLYQAAVHEFIELFSLGATGAGSFVSPMLKISEEVSKQHTAIIAAQIEGGKPDLPFSTSVFKAPELDKETNDGRLLLLPPDRRSTAHEGFDEDDDVV